MQMKRMGKRKEPRLWFAMPVDSSHVHSTYFRCKIYNTRLCNQYYIIHDISIQYFIQKYVSQVPSSVLQIFRALNISTFLKNTYTTIWREA